MSHYLRHCLFCEIHRCKHHACLELQLTLHTTSELHDVQEFKKCCITYCHKKETILIAILAWNVSNMEISFLVPFDLVIPKILTGINLQ